VTRLPIALAVFGSLFLYFGNAPIVEPPTAPAPGSRDAISVAPRDVVWIPAGSFVRGSDEREVLYAVELCTRQTEPFDAHTPCSPDFFVHETPRERVWVSAFGIDRTEVTQEAWRRCMRAGECTPPESSDADNRLAHPTHPVTKIDFADAAHFCAWVGGRLPSEAEWERAARGHDGRRFPWGRHYNDRLANHGRGRSDRVGGRPSGRKDLVDGYRDLAPVGSFPDAASPFGLLDMAGNVAEWTADVYSPEAYLTSGRVDPLVEGAVGLRVARGGSFFSSGYTLRVSYREAVPEGETFVDLGFRCAYDP
jgi:formylglycine-generating enzyme required for sulfatase activity